MRHGAVHALVSDLKLCSQRRDLQWGRRTHAKATQSKIESNLYVQSALIKMYARCGTMLEACRVFESIQKPNVVSWTALLLGYVENGEGRLALDLFTRMKSNGVAPDCITYVGALKACTSLAMNGDGNAKQQGREIHLEIGCHLDHQVQNTLIDMYAKCGSMVDARRVFDNIQKPSAVSWNALLLGYADNGEAHVCLDLFSRMNSSHGVAPDCVTYVAALKACASLANGGGKEYWLERGREIHSEVGCHLDHFVETALIDMYAKCGSMPEAHRVFDDIQKQSVVSWNALLSGYAENGEGHIALDLFNRMRLEHGCTPTVVTYIALLKSCGSIGALALGRKFHSKMSGEFSGQVVTCLVHFYAKCGSIAEAREVFDRHAKAGDALTWTALLAGYASFGDAPSVFERFKAMRDEGLQPDSVTFVCLLLCCSHAGLVQKARDYLEAMSVEYGLAPTVLHYTCMVDVLGRKNQLNEAIAMVSRMPCNPDAVTWVALLAACRKWKNVELGRMAFQSLGSAGQKVASSHILMASLCGGRGGVLQEQQLHTRNALEEAYVTDETGKMVRFVVGEAGAELYSSAADGETLCGHSERRAAAYGLEKTPPGEPIRVFKNTRMCDSCHESIKATSIASGRVLVVRDASRFHVVANGYCSCGDYW